MILGSYTLTDLLASLFSVLLFVPVLLAPGYVLAWTLDLFAFRSLDPRWRFLISIPLSIGISPIAIYWVGRVFTWTGVSVVFAFVSLVWVALMAGAFNHERPREWMRSVRDTPGFIWVAFGVWLVVALASLVDLQIGHRLYFSVVANDYSVRTAVTDAINHDGVHPFNPFYRITGPVPLRYHYFWFLPCSLVARMSGLADGSRPAMNASVVWCGWGLIALVPMYFRFLQRFSGAALRSRTKVAIALFAVTGLDIIPTAVNWTRHKVDADMEWWNADGQITSWFGSLLWVPHHTAGLLAGLISVLLLWHASLQESWPYRIAAGLVAGCTLASMVGCSVYVGVVFAAFLGAWTVLLLARRSLGSVSLLLAGGVTALLALPYLLSLAGQTGASSFLSFSVRHFKPLDHFMNRFHIPHWELIGLRLISLPVQYFFELGFFFVVPFVYLWSVWKRRDFGRNEILLFLLAAVPFFIASFIRSSVVETNDLGWRGFLPVQFVLLLWAADIVVNMRQEGKALGWRAGWFTNWKSAAWSCLLILGIVSNLYGVGILRFEGILADAGLCPPFFTKDRQLGKLTFGLRQGYEQMAKLLPSDAVIQANPEWFHYDFFLGLYAHRPTAAFDPDCGSEYGGNEVACKRIYPQIKEIFNEPIRCDAQDIQRLEGSLGVSAVVVYNLDDAWKSSAWPLHMRTIVQNDAMRVYAIERRRAAGD